MIQRKTCKNENPAKRLLVCNPKGLPPCCYPVLLSSSAGPSSSVILSDHWCEQKVGSDTRSQGAGAEGRLRRGKAGLTWSSAAALALVEVASTSPNAAGRCRARRLQLHGCHRPWATKRVQSRRIGLVHDLPSKAHIHAREAFQTETSHLRRALVLRCAHDLVRGPRRLRHHLALVLLELDMASIRLLRTAGGSGEAGRADIGGRGWRS